MRRELAAGRGPQIERDGRKAGDIDVAGDVIAEGFAALVDSRSDW